MGSYSQAPIPTLTCLHDKPVQHRSLGFGELTLHGHLIVWHDQ